MNLYYCIDDIGLRSEIGNFLKMSILSAVEFSGLSVKCIYCGDNPVFHTDMAKIGVEVISYKSRIDDSIIDAHNKIGFPLHARGAYLRYEICEIDSNEYSLYVDCDVFFKNKFILPESLPYLVAACHERGDSCDFNSGVLLINNLNFKKSIDGFLNYCVNKFGTWFVGVDQRPFNDYFFGKIESLDNIYNWRPYFGINDSALMIHFHGSKIEEIHSFLVNNIPDSFSNDFILERSNICSSDLPSVIHYFKLFHNYLGSSISPDFSKKYNDILSVFSIHYITKHLFINNANLFYVESFVNKFDFPSNINRSFVITDKPVGGFALYPARNFFIGSIIISFTKCSVLLENIIGKSSGYIVSNIKGDSIIIKYTTLSYASEISICISDFDFESMTIQIKGFGLGASSVFDSNNKLFQDDITYLF